MRHERVTDGLTVESLGITQQGLEMRFGEVAICQSTEHDR